LEAHEAKPSAPELQGHTIEKHVGKSEHWLRKRLNTDPILKNEDFCSSFRNEVVANRTQGRFVKQHRAEIEAWLKSGKGWKYQNTIKMEEPVGIVVERGKLNAMESQTARVVILRDSSPQGWHILTSFPIPE
jgi:Bacterial CdiA-CT RNAse A domain